MLVYQRLVFTIIALPNFPMIAHFLDLFFGSTSAGCTAAGFPVSHPVIHVNPQLNKFFDLLHLVNTCKYCILYRYV